MKILQIIDSFAIGGAERMAVNMANAFSENSIDNFIVCSRTSGPLKKFLPSITGCAELNKSSSFDLRAFYKLISVIKEQRPQIIHAHSSSIYWAFAAKLFFPSIKLIWHDHDGLSETLKDSDRKFLKKLSPFINGIVVVNEILEKWSLRNMKTKRVLYLKNFPYLKNLKTSVDCKKRIILHLANLRPQKDHFTLIEAIRIIKEKSSISFEVWCVGVDIKDFYSKSVKDLVRTYELDGSIKFLGSTADANSMLQKASIGVLSSQSEGLPVSLLEYGLASLPVVVSDVGQCSEVVGNGKFGLVVPPSNPEKLAEAIYWHIHNPKESREMGMSFQNHVNREYGSEKFLAEYIKFSSEL